LYNIVDEVYYSKKKKKKKKKNLKKKKKTQTQYTKNFCFSSISH